MTTGSMNGSPWMWIYKLSMIVWVVIGIGYWAMVIAFITKAFKVHIIYSNTRSDGT